MQPTAGDCGGGVCWWSQRSETCQSAGVPCRSGRPNASLDGTTSLPPLYFGFTRTWIGDTDLKGNASVTAWQTFGFDLDAMECGITP